MLSRSVLGSAAGCAAAVLRRSSSGHAGSATYNGTARGRVGVLQSCRDIHTTPQWQRTWAVAPPRQPSVHPHGSRTSDLPLPEQQRALMRLVAGSVTVCTTAATTAQDPPLGLTMSSLASLSLKPTPIVSFNIAVPSRTEAAIREGRRFAVHVLRGDERGAAVAEVYRKGNADAQAVRQGLAEAGCEVGEQGMLSGPGVLFALRCRLLDEPMGGLVPVRDHVVVLGEVLEIVEGAGAVGEGEDEFGLVYADRHYRQLGNTLLRPEDED